MPDDSLSDERLNEIERRCTEASPGPWLSFVGPAIGGPDFIRISDQDDEPDMYVDRDGKPASPADLDFIAHARQDLPLLLAEVRRLRERDRS